MLLRIGLLTCNICNSLDIVLQVFMMQVCQVLPCRSISWRSLASSSIGTEIGSLSSTEVQNTSFRALNSAKASRTSLRSAVSGSIKTARKSRSLRSLKFFDESQTQLAGKGSSVRSFGEGNDQQSQLSIERAQSMPSGIRIHCSSSDSDASDDAVSSTPPDSNHIVLRQENCVLMSATVYGDTAVRGKFTAALSDALRNTNGETNIFDVFTEASNGMADHVQIPELTSTLRKKLFI